MAFPENGPNVRDRVLAVLRGEKPDRHPFIDRITLWHLSHSRAGDLPGPYAGKSVTEVHRAIGMGEQSMHTPYCLRLHGVEVSAHFRGEEIYRETDPIADAFPDMSELVPLDKAGMTEIRLSTPQGMLTMTYELVQDMVIAGQYPYLREHPMKNLGSDLAALEYIISHAEYIPKYDRMQQVQTDLGEIGYVVPLITRIPFQQVLLDYLGEIATFYALADEPERVDYMMRLLDDQMMGVLNRLKDFDWMYIEVPDNLHGLMTNPRLFKQHCMPHYQKYADILHAQGKKFGSHTDGNVKPLLALLTESGLDVCESFSPTPLTECTFEEAWQAWQNGPIIWGGIPSPILEPRYPEQEFKEYIARLLHIIGDRPIILGVGDLVLNINDIERVKYVAEQIEACPLV
jgi:hypothetical protein